MANWDAVRQEWENSKITLKALAEKHDVKLGTLKSRKSRESWSRDATNEKDATKSKMVATSDKDAKNKATSKARKTRSGNPNPKNQFTKRNTAAVKHGFFSKYIPQDTLDIMGMMNKDDPADLLWDQIQIQYAAIVRSQKIMFVESKGEMIKELKKIKEVSSDFNDTKEKEWEFQFAWERQASFLNAQSRAISELRTSIRQFVDMTHEDDERKLKLEYMQTNIDKAKAEAERIKQEQGQVVEDIVIVDAWSDDDD